MKNNQYLKLREQVSKMNKINDEISLINWNREDGPKFTSIEEMKEFEYRLKNNELDHLFEDEDNIDIFDTKDVIIESFSHTLEYISFYIYTYQNKSNDKYFTYLSLTNKKDNDVIDKLCGNFTSDRKMAHNYFETLKQELTTNTIDDILENLIIGAQNTIVSLNNKLSKLTSES